MRNFQAPFKNFVIAGVNENMLSLLPSIVGNYIFLRLFFEGRISFYCNNLDLLPPKPKFTFRHMKKGILEFHRTVESLSLLYLLVIS